ncbi:MAG: hypothetical protein WCY70_02610 [Methanoculleus sp.]
MHDAFGAPEILDLIRSLLADPDVNRFGPDLADPAWEDPLLGVSCGDDPLYAEFRETIGPFHWTPLEAFCAGFPGAGATASDLAVIVWALPQTAATPRLYDNRTAYCLHFSEKGCGACIRRCPAGAISADGHDKERCFAYIRERVVPFVESDIGVPATSCGLCQAGVPCEARRPR